MPQKILLLDQLDEPGALRLVNIFDARGRRLGNPIFPGWCLPCELVTRYLWVEGDGNGLVKAKDWLSQPQMRVLGVGPDTLIEIREN